MSLMGHFRPGRARQWFLPCRLGPPKADPKSEPVASSWDGPFNIDGAARQLIPAETGASNHALRIHRLRMGRYQAIACRTSHPAQSQRADLLQPLISTVPEFG